MIEYLWCFYESKIFDENCLYIPSNQNDKKIGELLTDRFTAMDIRNLLQKKNKHFVYVIRQSTKAE